MDGEIIPRGVILKRAEEAAKHLDCPYRATLWPIGTAAGQQFVREFHAARAKRRASEQQTQMD